MITSLRMNLTFLAGSAEEEISTNRWRQIAQMQQKAIEESQSSAANATNNTSADPNLRNYGSDNAGNRTKSHQPSKSSDFHKTSPALNATEIKSAKDNQDPLRSSLDSDAGAEGRARAYSLSDRLVTPTHSRGNSLASPMAPIMPTVTPPQSPEVSTTLPKKKSAKTGHIDAFLESINQGVFQPFYFEQMVRSNKHKLILFC